MATLTNAQRAPLLIGGAGVGTFQAGIESSDPAVAALVDKDGAWYISGVAPGDATITADIAGRHGELEVTVTAAPLVLALGTPEPK